MTTAEVFRTAATLLKEQGWIQGKAQSEEGMCLMAAVDTVELMECGPRNMVRLETIRRGGSGSVTSWNDEEGRTLEEVLDVLETCAVRAEAMDEGSK